MSNYVLTSIAQKLNHVFREASIVIIILLSYTALQCFVSIFYVYQSNALRHGLIGHLSRVYAHTAQSPKSSRKIDRLVRRYCLYFTSQNEYYPHSLISTPITTELLAWRECVLDDRQFHILYCLHFTCNILS